VSFNLTEMDHVVALWFVGGEGVEVDWMGVVFREKGARDWAARYRFRYHSGTKDPFDQTDHKSWFEARGDDVHKLVEAIDLAASMMAKDWGVAVDRVDVNGEPNLLVEKLQTRPWAHLKLIPTPS
jgi:hypothetical protein